MMQAILSLQYFSSVLSLQRINLNAKTCCYIHRICILLGGTIDQYSFSCCCDS